MKSKEKLERYGVLKLILRVLTLIIAIWALVVAYQAKDLAEWNEKVIDNVIVKTLFKDHNFN